MWERPNPARILAVLLLLTLLAMAAAGQVVYVDRDARGADDGSSWGDAWVHLDDALAAATPGSQVWVAEGSYRPLQPPGDPREATFALADGLELYGGFAGGEAALPQRDPLAHPVILEGDLGHGVLAYHVLSATGVTALLDGFTVRNGSATGFDSADRIGGGLTASGGDLTFVGCRFEDNEASLAGGAVSSSATSLFRGCHFAGNSCNAGGAVNSGGPSITFEACTFSGNGFGLPSTGGALRVAWGLVGGSLLVEGCSFDGNSAGSGGAIEITGPAMSPGPVRIQRSSFSGNSGVHGGALVLTAVPDVAIVDCDFVGNSISNVGGALFLSNTDARIARCRFLGNQTAYRGGAIGLVDPGTLGTGSSPHISDCLFAGNGADFGGALLSAYGSHPRLSGCTFVGNTATTTGGALYDVKGGSIFGDVFPTVELANSVLWGNSDGAGTGEGSQIAHVDGTLFVDHCDVQGWSGAFGGTGNIGADPLLVDADGPDDAFGTPDDDPRLGAGSPCIDAGDGGALLADGADADCDGDTSELQPLDLLGHVRVVDDPATVDAGAGGPPVVDMGAHEWGAPLPADVWTDLGGGSSGIAGVPSLALAGTLCGGQELAVSLTDGAPSTLVLLWLSVSSTPLAIFGGTLHAFPYEVEFALPSDASGGFQGSAVWPLGVPSGAPLWFQVIVFDGSVVGGITLSNAVTGTTP